MEEKIWHLTDDFNKLPARDVLKNILRDDRKNYDKAESELGEDIKLLDDAIILYIEPLQEAYRRVDEWKSKATVRASIAMVESTLNYILLARHGILLGYYPEARDLLRNCYERTSRCYLFFVDERQAKRFLSGKRISQPEVDEKLSKLEKQEKVQELYRGLRKYYSFLSEAIHPNLKSFEARYGKPNLKERVGLEPVFGGLLSSVRGRIVVLRVLQSVLSTLRILGYIVAEQSGAWNKDYERIKSASDRLLEQLTDSTL